MSVESAWPNNKIISFNRGIDSCIDLVGKRRAAIEDKNAKPEDGFHYFIDQAQIAKYEELERSLEELKLY